MLEISLDKLLPPDIYVDRGVLRARRCKEGVMASRGRRPDWGSISSPESDADLVDGAKARIRELEKEAETLEEA